MPDNDLKLKNDVDAKNVSVFSFINHYSFKKDIAESVYTTFPDNRPNEIKKQILMENYFPSEFDLFLIFKHFDIPVILRMNALQKMFPSYYYRAYNCKKSSQYYLIVANREKTKNNTYCLLKYNDVYRIDSDLINNEPLYLDFKKKKQPLENTVITIDEIVLNNIKILEEAKRIARERDLKRKRKVKKVGKRKLKK